MRCSQQPLRKNWTVLLAVDKEFHLRYTDSICAKDLSPHLAEFLAHCCRQRHYFFDILKCGKSDCKLHNCLPLSSLNWGISLTLFQALMITISHLVKFSVQQQQKRIVHLHVEANLLETQTKISREAATRTVTGWLVFLLWSTAAGCR